MIKSRSQGELRKKGPKARTVQQLCCPVSTKGMNAMHGAKKHKRVTLPNYASQMGGREARLLGKCEVELAEWRVLSAS